MRWPTSTECLCNQYWVVISQYDWTRWMMWLVMFSFSFCWLFENISMLAEEKEKTKTTSKTDKLSGESFMLRGKELLWKSARSTCFTPGGAKETHLQLLQFLAKETNPHAKGSQCKHWEYQKQQTPLKYELMLVYPEDKTQTGIIYEIFGNLVQKKESRAEPFVHRRCQKCDFWITHSCKQTTSLPTNLRSAISTACYELLGVRTDTQGGN